MRQLTVSETLALLAVLFNVLGFIWGAARITKTVDFVTESLKEHLEDHKKVIDPTIAIHTTKIALLEQTEQILTSK